eukprot:GHVR01122445.1.p1 GENE.GHVR01122445.1~~GHVR01122445.1.p1  ORF type:complete len:684 (+),score=124.11 GHVR01122445.1:300-2351(+)
MENNIETEEIDTENLELHAELIEEFDDIVSSSLDERKQCLEDRRFYSIAGAQWEGALAEQFENKPKLEVNKIHLSIMRIFSEYRNNRIAVDFLPKNGDDALADVCDGLYRADEQDSNAEEAYDNAFEEAVGGGIGAWRLKAEYEDEDDDENEEQRIKIEPIYDADSSVYFDLNAKRQDKSDALKCYVLNSMHKKAFIAEYGEDKISSIKKQVDDTEFDWSVDDAVYVAEVYKVEKVPHIVRTYKLPGGSLEEKYTKEDMDESPEIENDLLSRGLVLDREKKTKKQKVRKLIISGGEILEDCGYIAGNYIPIIPVYGKRWFVDNVERCMGHVRLAKDPQRLTNMMKSKLAELSAAPSTEKPILTADQIRGHEQTWADDNIENFPYLPVNAIKDQNGNIVQTGPVGYTKPPAVPPALAALIQLGENDINDVLGNQQDGERIVSGISGEAVEKIQDRLDMQTFIYVSNLAKAMKWAGKVWLSMARELYVEEAREMKVINKDSSADVVNVNKMAQDDEGVARYKNDLTKAKFDVTVDVGASTSTKRKSTVKSIKDMMMASGDQETISILSSLAIMNMEGEGVTDARKYFRNKLVRSGVLEPTKEEIEKMTEESANQQPDANTLYLQAESEKSLAQADKARADTILTQAKADETIAKTMETIAGMERADQEQLMSIINTFKQGVGNAQ